MSEIKACEHEYFHATTHYQGKSNGYSKTKYSRLDIYFCHKCLDQKEVEREETVWNEDQPPIWWQH